MKSTINIQARPTPLIWQGNVTLAPPPPPLSGTDLLDETGTNITDENGLRIGAPE